MLKNKLKLLFVPVLLFLTINARAQGLVEWIDEVIPTVPDMKAVYISDLTNFLDVDKIPVYLTATGTIHSAGDNPNQRYILEFQLIYNDGSLPLVSQKTKPFTLAQFGLKDGDPIRFTNLIFANGRFSPKQNGQNLEWDAPEINEQGDFSLDNIGASLIPTGVYKLTGNFYREGQPEEPDAGMIMNITGIPSFLELIYPGVEYGAQDVPAIYQEYPVLQWRPDNGKAFSKFYVKVWEQFDFQNSLDEVIQSDPVLDYTYETPAGIFSLPYQSIPGAEPLQIGHTYVWNVEGVVPTSSGANSVTVKSPYFVFTVKQPGSSVGSAFGEIEFTLKTLFNGEIPEDVVQKLAGSSFNGTIKVNGQPVSPQELSSLINKLQQDATAAGKSLGDYLKSHRVVEN